MENKRKVLSDIENQIHYITEENIQLEDLHRRGQEAYKELLLNREKLKDLMQNYLEAKI